MQPHVMPMLNAITLMEASCAHAMLDMKEMALLALVWTGFSLGVTSMKLFYSDVDECAMSIDNCDPTNGVCTNTEASFICTCTIGYSGDGINCTSKFHCYTVYRIGHFSRKLFGSFEGQ